MLNSSLEERKERKEGINEKIRAVLTYVGWMLSGIFSIVYIIVLLILIFGFRAQISGENILLIASIGAFFTFAITMSLMYQGILLAKNYPAVKAVEDEYFNVINKQKPEKKIKTIKYYLIKTTLSNIFFKAGTVLVTTYAVINFIVMGMQDIMILWLGIANILMATGFGLLTLLSAYDFYLDQHIPALRIKTEKLKSKPSGVDTTTKETTDAKN